MKEHGRFSCQPGGGDMNTAEKCGTYAGAQEHRKHGERVCVACRHATSVYMGQWRVRSGRTKNAAVPYEVLGKLLSCAPTEVEEWAESRLGDAVVTRAIEAARVDQPGGGQSVLFDHEDGGS